MSKIIKCKIIPVSGGLHLFESVGTLGILTRGGEGIPTKGLIWEVKPTTERLSITLSITLQKFRQKIYLTGSLFK